MKPQDPNLQEIVEIIRLLTLIESHLAHLTAPLVEHYDIQQVCEHFHITRHTLENYRKKGILKSGKLGGRVYFRISDIKDKINSAIDLNK